MVSALLAACATPAIAPTAPPSTAAAATNPTSPPAAAPSTAPSVVVAKPSAAPSPSAAAAAPAAPAAAGGGGSSKPRAIIGIVQEPTSLDPTADATASIATTLRDNLYEGLVRLDGSGKI